MNEPLKGSPVPMPPCLPGDFRWKDFAPHGFFQSIYDFVQSTGQDPIHSEALGEVKRVRRVLAAAVFSRDTAVHSKQRIEEETEDDLLKALNEKTLEMALETFHEMDRKGRERVTAVAQRCNEEPEFAKVFQEMDRKFSELAGAIMLAVHPTSPQFRAEREVDLIKLFNFYETGYYELAPEL